MNKYYIDNCRSLTNIYGYGFFNNFIQINVSDAMDIIRNHKYQVIKDDEKQVVLSFKKPKECKSTFEIINNSLQISCDCDLQNNCEHIFATYLYIVYKYTKFNTTSSLYPVSHFYGNQIKEFTSYFIAINGYAIFLEKNFSTKRFIDFLLFSLSRNFEAMGDVRYNLIMKSFFSIKLDLTDMEFSNLTNELLSEFSLTNGPIFLSYLTNFIYSLLDKNKALILIDLINRFLKKNANYTRRELNKQLTFLSSKVTYEYIDKEKGIESLRKQAIDNEYASNYYINVVGKNGDIDLSEIYNNKKFYSLEDLKVFKENPNWSYEIKAKALSNLLASYYDLSTYTQIKEVLGTDLTRFLNENINTLKKNPHLFEKIAFDVLDIDLILAVCNGSNFNNLNKYTEIFKKDYSKCFIYFINYIKNKDFYYLYDINFIAIFDLFKGSKWGSYYNYILLKLVQTKNPYFSYSSKVYIEELKKYFIKNEIVISNIFYNEFINALNMYNLKDLITKKVNQDFLTNTCNDPFIYDDLLSFSNDFKNVFETNILYKINPRTILYELKLKDGYTVASLELTEKEDNAIFKCDMYNQPLMLLYLLKNIYEKYYLKENNLDFDKIKEELEKTFIALEDKYKEEQEETLKKQSKDIMKRLVSIVSANEVANSNQDIDLETHIYIVKNYNDNYIKFCSFRVGSNKYYTVKNYDNFITSIRGNEDVSYGKGLTFNHNINSFNERSQIILNSIIGQNIFSSYPINNDHRFFRLNDYTLDLIIKNSSYCYVDYDHAGDVKLNIINNPINPTIYIDKEYNVNCIYDNLDNQVKENITGKIMTGYEHDYLITNDAINIIACKKEIKNLCNYLITNNGINIKYVKNNFKTEIYARYLNDIQINEEIASEFKLTDLTIKAYFDYSSNDNGKDQITLNQKFFINKKEISIDDIKKQAYLVKKYSIYESLINNLGFVDNRLTDLKSIYQFLHADLTKLKEVCEVFLSDNIKIKEAKEYASSSVYMSYNSGLLDVCFNDSSYTEEELYKIMASLRKKVHYIKLNENVIIKVDDKQVEELNLVNELDLDIKKLKHQQEVPLYQSLKLISELNFSGFKISDQIKEMLKEISDYKTLNYDLPDCFKDVMRDYQIDAFKWIKTLSKYSFSGILADDMGLGKSLEIISVLASDDHHKPSLIVCPKSLVYNWQNEFIKWKSDIPSFPITGNANERHKAMINFNENEKQVFIISYDSLKNDLELFNKFNFRYLILDEAQFIKNHTTLKAQSVKKINSELRFALTGTPIENSVIDLWSIFDFLMPKYLYNYSQFKQSYEKNIVEKDEKTIEKLVKKVTPFILRRTKEQVLLDLPEKIEIVRVVDMLPSQRKYYESQILKTRLILEGSSSKIDILAALTRLRQLCVDPGLFINDYTGGSSKYETIIEILDEYIDKHKIIIFSQFTQAFVAIEKILNEKKIKFEKITGETSALARIDIANNFNETDDFKVLLVSLKAGGTGLNLIGADIVCHLDPWWNVAAQNQASDRAHRIGQTNVVQVIKIICRNSIEQKVLELQEIKKDLVEKLIATDDANIQKLTESDIKYLLD